MSARKNSSSPHARKGGAKKPRWTAEQRVAKGRESERPRGGAAPRTGRRGFDDTANAGRKDARDRRRDWTPPKERPAARRARGPVRDRAGDAHRDLRDEGSFARRDGHGASRAAGYGRPRRAERFDERRPERFESRRPERRTDHRGSTRHTAPRHSDRRDQFSRAAERDVPAFVADTVLERFQAAAITAEEVADIGFADLGLGQNIVRVLGELGAERPFPIQAATIPVALSGRDVLGRGRTGSGKTIAFGAPLVERLLENGGGRKREPGRRPRALVLAPTRELALQLDRTIQPIARSVGLFTTQLYGGVPYHRQVTALQRGVDIVIGTPGRIEDLVESGRLDLGGVEIAVLDEADHMCDLGFLEPVQRILRLTAQGGQRMLFSATLDRGVAALVEEFLVDPSIHEVAGEDQESATIEHRVLLIEQSEKRRIVTELARGEGKTLVFARTRAFAEELADELADAGIRAVSLHGDLSQARRTRNLERLASGRASVLVATDVAARGIHVDDITLVVQADPPEEYKTYLHRAGRTGRAGREGTVVTLVNSRRRRRVDELLGRAEITPIVDRVRAGDALLEELAAR